MDSVGVSDAGLFAIFGALAYDIIAAACSSPQTTEINADARSDTLMKWVYLGMAQVALFTLVGVALQRAQKKPVWPPIAGSLLGGGLMYVSYVYAKNCGLNDGKPGTESYN